MASRRETENRKQALLANVRAKCRSGQFLPGETVPTVRHLAEEFHLSKDIVHDLIQSLAAEGTLHTVPGVGTFVGKQARHIEETYLFITVPGPFFELRNEPMRIGFEDKIAEMGAVSLSLTWEKMRDFHARGELPRLNGVFYVDARHDPNLHALPAIHRIPQVVLYPHPSQAANVDIVSFDDLEGGRQAANHLLALGNRRIAFLSLHGPDEQIHEWLVKRAQGWRLALTAANCFDPSLCFLSDGELGDNPDCYAVGEKFARRLIKRPDITAVVACNDEMALGVFRGLRALGVPREEWPVFVGFDDLPDAGIEGLSSLRLPWEEAGRAAAEILWQRSHGLLADSPIVRKVPLRLLSRLTSRSGWSSRMEMVPAIVTGN